MDNAAYSYDPKAGFPINIKNWVLPFMFSDSLADFITEKRSNEMRLMQMVYVTFDADGTANMPINEDTVNNVVDKLVHVDPSIVKSHTMSEIEDIAVEIIGQSRRVPLYLTRMDLVEAFSIYAEAGYIVTDTSEFREAFKAAYPKVHAMLTDPELDDMTPIKFVDPECKLMSKVIVDIVDAYVRTTHPEYDGFCPLIYNFINTAFDIKGGRRVINKGNWDK